MEENFSYELSSSKENESKLELNEHLSKKFVYKSVVKSLKNTEKDV